MRLFAAIYPDEPMKNALCAAISRLQAAALGGSFTRLQNLHLTLAFIGETTRLQPACRAVQGITAAPFPLTLGDAGCFKRPGGDICWLGPRQSAALAQLQRQLTRRLADEGFMLEPHPFTPHFTLGRRVVLPPGFDWTGLQPSAPITMTVSRICLMQSLQGGGGQVYTEIAAKELMGGSVNGV